MKKRINKLTIYTIVFSVCFFSVNIILGLALTKQSDAAIREQIESRMLDVCNLAASDLNGDMLRDVSADDIYSDDYQYTLEVLSRYQNTIGLEYIYCARDMGNDRFAFTIDPSDDPGEFGEEILYTEALHQASLGTAAVDKEPYGDRWGRFYSAYCPVFDSNGKVGGIVCVDFDADWYEEQIAGLIRTTGIVTALSTSFTFIIIIGIVSNYRRRIKYILDEMNNVTDGIETLVNETYHGRKKEVIISDEHRTSNDDIAELTDKIISLEDKLSDEIEYVRSQAYIDQLSGLGNRTAYEEHIELIDKKIMTEQTPFNVIVFDINGLKTINDTYGHDKGDSAIVTVSTVLKEIFENFNIYRVGGDEFIVIIEEKLDESKDLINKVTDSLKENDIVSVSKGFASFVPYYDMRYKDVFQRADQTMYEDKREYYRTHTDRRRKEN